MIAAPLVGSRCSGSTLAQAAAGGGTISLTMMAPSGTGGGGAAGEGAWSSRRLVLSHSTMSGEYQVTTGAWVPKYLPVHLPFSSVPTNGPVSRTCLSRVQPDASSRWQ